MTLNNSAKGSWRVISTPFVNLGNGTARLFRVVSTNASRVWPAVNSVVGADTIIFFRNQGTGVQSVIRLFSTASATVGRDLKSAIFLLGRSILTLLVLVLRNARSGMLILPVVAGVLIFSPLLLFRFVIDPTFRQNTAARAVGLLAQLKARPALGLLGVGAVVSLSLAVIWLPSLIWPTPPVVEVLIWSSPEKQDILDPVLQRLNESNLTVTVNDRRYRVESELGRSRFGGNPFPSGGRAYRGNKFSATGRWVSHCSQPIDL